MNLFQAQLVLRNGETMAEYWYRKSPAQLPLQSDRRPVSVEEFERDMKDAKCKDS